MSSAAYYRVEAERCRKLAAASPDPAMATRWRQLASEYETLAQSLESGVPPPLSGSQPQPMQQQQSKTTDKK
jgi:hypothetical protein